MAYETDQKATYSAVAASFMVILAVEFSVAFPANYLPEMMLWLGSTEWDKGYYVGVVTAVYYIGAFVASYPISWLSGRVGQRPIMLGVMIANSAFCLVFAFSNHLIMVVCLNFFIGMCNSSISLAFALLSLYSNKRNKTFNMAIGSLAWGVGLNLGAVVGGYLSSPVTKYPNVFSHIRLFARFPYIMPPFIGTFWSLTTALVIVVFYPDQYNVTLKRNSANSEEHANIDVQASSISRYSSMNVTVQEQYSPPHAESVTKSSSISSAAICNQQYDISHDIVVEPTIGHGDDDTNEKCRCWEMFLQSTLAMLLKNKDAMKVLLATTLVNSAGVTYVAIFSTWASTNEDLGGLSYTTSSIGAVMGFVVIPCAVFLVVVAPLIERRIGSVHMLIVFTTMFSIAATLVPTCRLINNPHIQWVTLVIVQVIVTSSESGANICIQMLKSNCVTPHQFAAFNGLSRSFKMLFQTLYSLVAGSIYAGSISSDIGSPVDYNLVFVFIGATMWMAAIIGSFMPRAFDTNP